MNLVNGIVKYHDEMIQWRHDLHRHPEVCYQETRTAAKVAELLRSFGLDEVNERVGKTGVVGILKNGEGPAIGLRADMDALALSDEGRHGHRSTIAGLTHACGHDGHTAMLLGAAKYLALSRRFRGTVVFVFQPAEEVTTGAVSMLEEGILERHALQSIYALHSFPGLAVGRMSITPDTALASVDNFTVTIRGHSGHAGAPHLACDPIIAAAAVITGLQTIVSRTVDPLDSVVVSVTSVRSSSNLHNVIPEAVQIKGTVRYLNTWCSDVVPRKMKTLIQGVAEGHGVTAGVTYERKCPPVVNSPRESRFATEIARSLLGDAGVVQLPPIMSGEDFSFFLERIPGVLAFIGNGEDSPPLHNAAFDFNDEALPIGASYLARVVEVALA